MRYYLLFFSIVIISYTGFSQGCCSGGSGSPIAGGTSQGVLREKQIELAGNYNYMKSNKFMVENRDTAPLFDKLSSEYLYFQVGYGISKRFTIDVATGYFLDKSLTELKELENQKTNSAQGFGDLLILPRYDVYFKSSDTRKTEFTIGLGYKIPLGSHKDSSVIFENPTTGDKYYTILPPTVQLTNGSQDFILYLFALHGFPLKKLNIFANAIHIRKGFNSLGQKFGNYTNAGLFVSKSFLGKLGVTLQLKGEWIGKMESAKNIDQVAFYNLDPRSTGSKKLFFVPQINYTYKQVTFYGLSEFPLYQYVYGSQVASDINLTFGISYRYSKLCPTDIPKPENE